jgi:flagellar basal-body rod modification protein FlgD
MSTTIELANEALYTAVQNDTSTKVTGAASANLTQTEFFTLITQQLQFQDPMEPTDNSEFVTQTTQMSQLTATQAMQSTSANSQAASLVGENVTVIDPEDDTNNTTITGTVTSATLNGTDSYITIDDLQYPISSLKSVNVTPTTTTTSGT